MPAESHVPPIEKIVSGWTQGWAISRGTPTPVTVDGAYRVDVGLPGHAIRYVLPHFDPVVMDWFACTLTDADIWLKICAPEAEVAPLLPAHWILHETEYLMTSPLTRAETETPAGYNLQVYLAGKVIEAKLYDTDGELAASGRAALYDGYAVIDQVITDVAHRRRGLGSVVMRALGDHAAQQHAHTGILVATEEGLALYSKLGWTLQTPITPVVTAG